jgi:hypothetical protein
MFSAVTLLLALSAVQPTSNATSHQCHQYDGAVFYGRIRQLRLRRSTPHAWSAEDPYCDRFFFPAKLSPALDPKLAQRITDAVNSRRGDDYIELDAQVRIRLDADHSGGVLTVVGLPRRR